MRRDLSPEQLKEFLHCKRDVVYFVKTYGWTKHTTRGAIRWDKPYKYQVLLWQTLQNGDNTIVNKTRQIGCSWAVCAFSVWLMVFHPNIEILFLSETERKAIRLLENARFFLSHLPSFLAPAVTQNAQTRLEVTFSAERDGMIITAKSSIDSLTTTGRSGASYSARFVVLDEAAHLPNGEAVYGAIMPSTSHGGQVVIVSTPNGMDNFFYRIWHEATSEEEYRFIAIEAYWKECGLSETWFKRATAGLTIQQVLQEYEMKFLPTGSPFFDLGQLADCYMPKKDYKVITDALGNVVNGRTRMHFSGVDTAGGRRLKSGGKPDYTSIVTLNEYGVEVDSWHSQETPLEEVSGYMTVSVDGVKTFMEGKVSQWHRKYPGAMVIERWGPGDVVFLNHYMNAPDDDRSYVVGRRTTSGMNSNTSKIRILNALRLAIAGRQLIITDPFTYYCLQTFTDRGGGKYEANAGSYDDPVIALALAYHELHKYGGILLDIDSDTDGSGRRMIGVRKEDDLPQGEIGVVIPVGVIVEGPLFDSEAGDYWRDNYDGE